ncbi:SH3 domain-containing protein [Caldalkalibacillus mannanilyticus]|uniref:SH3 domain-containing protein n=1 Tax=Caldalkalibacillus mannanilyticus TaxID=1418 RepID=UPI00046868DD|nr:SH3 domain-containing protein [Caldalkalibacillus mannanilyticus]
MILTFRKHPLFLVCCFLLLLLGGSQSVYASGELTVKSNVLNVRSGPGLEHKIIGQISQSEVYRVEEEKQDWYKISLDKNQSGWVASWLVDYKKSSGTTKLVEATSNQINVRSGPGTDFKVVTQIKPKQTFPLLKQEGDWIQIQLNGNEKGWVAGWLVTTSEGERSSATQVREKVKVQASVLNVRSKPDTSSSILGKLEQGTEIEVIEAQKGWYKIKFNQEFGWIAGEFVTPANESSPAVAKQQSPLKNQPKVTILNQGTNIRKGPGTNHEVVSRANQGDTFDVVSTSGEWFEIQLQDGSKGFVAGWIVSTEGISSVDKHTLLSYLKGKKIVIDAGHGGKDSGATGSHFDTLEKIVNLEVSNLLKSKFEAAEASVTMTRSTDRFISLQQRVTVSTSEKADVFLSIHHNTNENSKVNGTITYFYSNGQDRVLANTIQKELVKNNGLQDLKARQGNFYVLRENPQLAVLIELGFLTNYNDELTIRTTKFQENSATGILHGVAKYFKDKEE